MGVVYRQRWVEQEPGVSFEHIRLFSAPKWLRNVAVGGKPTDRVRPHTRKPRSRDGRRTTRTSSVAAARLRVSTATPNDGLAPAATLLRRCAAGRFRTPLCGSPTAASGRLRVVGPTCYDALTPSVMQTARAENFVEMAKNLTGQCLITIIEGFGAPPDFGGGGQLFGLQ